MKHVILSIRIVSVAAMVLTGCKPHDGGDTGRATMDATEQLPAKYRSQEPVAKLDFSEAAKAPAFRQAIQEAAALLGALPQPLHAEAEGEELKGGVSFDVPQKKIEAVLRRAHTNFLARGFYLFRYDQNFGIGGNPDKVGLLPTADKYAVVAAMDTNGDNYGIGTAGVIAWMKDLEREQPFILTGIGFDYLEGYFTTPVKDPKGLAQRMYEFCPDIVDQGVGTVSKLARELRDGSLYFWWD
jgi:hypothetical protein